jgi:hypothetical protein
MELLDSYALGGSHPVRSPMICKSPQQDVIVLIVEDVVALVDGHREQGVSRHCLPPSVLRRELCPDLEKPKHLIMLDRSERR